MRPHLHQVQFCSAEGQAHLSKLLLRDIASGVVCDTADPERPYVGTSKAGKGGKWKQHEDAVKRAGSAATHMNCWMCCFISRLSSNSAVRTQRENASGLGAGGSIGSIGAVKTRASALGGGGGEVHGRGDSVFDTLTCSPATSHGGFARRELLTACFDISRLWTVWGQNKDVEGY